MIPKTTIKVERYDLMHAKEHLGSVISRPHELKHTLFSKQKSFALVSMQSSYLYSVSSTSVIALQDSLKKAYSIASMSSGACAPYRILIRNERE